MYQFETQGPLKAGQIVRSLSLGVVLMFAGVGAARAEDFGPLYAMIFWGLVISVVLGLVTTGWVAAKSQRRWMWFLAPLFVLSWLFVCAAVFNLYASR
jgi:hypothetical protein